MSQSSVIENGQRSVVRSSLVIPNSFRCPLTLEVMVDPVLDTAGNTFERKALLQWLSHYGISPISREPLNSNLVVPNFALRDAIHDMMGKEWVSKRKKELETIYINESRNQDESDSSSFNHFSRWQKKMDCYLSGLSESTTQTLELRLDEDGVCTFHCGNMMVVVEVPPEVGFFFLYTTFPVATLTDQGKDTLLELNRLQHETRGGSLSAHKHESGAYDIFFSYSDRIDEISSADFSNILPNFVDTAAKLRAKLMFENSYRVRGEYHYMQQ